MPDRQGMRLREIVTEAWRNTLSDASRIGIVCLALSLSGLTLLVADTLATHSDIEQAISYQRAGAAIKTIGAAGSIDAAACEAIAAVTGVRAAGAIRRLEQPLTPRALPGSTLPAYEVTPAFAELLGSSAGGGGILLSHAAAQRLGLSAGDTLPFTTGTAVIAATYAWPDDGRRGDLGYAALLPRPAAGAFDECWAASWPESDELTGLLRSTTIAVSTDASASPAADSAPVLGSVNETLGTRFRGEERYAGRVTQHAPLAALIAATLTMGIAVRTRRLELTTALHFGVRRGDLLAIALVETIIALAPVWLISLTVVQFIGLITPTDSAAVIGIGLRVTAALTVGALVGVTAAALLIRPNALLSAFKNR